MNKVGISAFIFSDSDYNLLKDIINDKSSVKITFRTKSKNIDDWKRIIFDNYGFTLTDEYINENFEIIYELCKLEVNYMSKKLMNKLLSNPDDLRRIFYRNKEYFRNLFNDRKFLYASDYIWVYQPDYSLQDFLNNKHSYVQSMRDTWMDEDLQPGYKEYILRGSFKGVVPEGAVNFTGNPNLVSLPGSIKSINLSYESMFFDLKLSDNLTNLEYIDIKHVSLTSITKLPDSLLYLVCGLINDVILPEGLKYLKCMNIKNTTLPDYLEVFICRYKNDLTLNKNLKVYHGSPKSVYPDLIHLTLTDRVSTPQEGKVPKSLISMGVVNDLNIQFPENLKYLRIMMIKNTSAIPKNLKLLIYSDSDHPIPSRIETVISERSKENQIGELLCINMIIQPLIVKYRG